ncbi:hypothetical protein ZWY2020_036545 [Hordeum vulgare]|nr:hypothetical protein ZWY2020_036545 [Hordeum vulgare]
MAACPMNKDVQYMCRKAVITHPLARSRRHVQLRQPPALDRVPRDLRRQVQARELHCPVLPSHGPVHHPVGVHRAAHQLVFRCAGDTHTPPALASVDCVHVQLLLPGDACWTPPYTLSGGGGRASDSPVKGSTTVMEPWPRSRKQSSPLQVPIMSSDLQAVNVAVTRHRSSNTLPPPESSASA